jgi:hypothetical protein
VADRFDTFRRLEPRRPGQDQNDGLAAPLADPLWLLGRQWQLGEQQGENASSPVRVRLSASSTPLEPPADRPTADPTTTPTEAIVEGEPEDWWTVGRRIRIGRQAGPFISGVRPGLFLRNLAPPYDQYNESGYDGRLLYEQHTALGLPTQLFAEVPDTAGSHWQPADLYYRTKFSCGDATLQVERHDGGEVDWWAVDADTDPGAVPPPSVEVFPNRFSYPGAPHPRWWQIEDAQHDPGGYPPDRGHFASMLLLRLTVGHANDWFLLPVDASIGSIVTLHYVTVIDAFGDEWPLLAPTDWSLFRVRGLDRTSLLLAVTAATPLVSDPIEDVVLGIDEDANVVWAVEQRADGRSLDTTPPDRTATVRPIEPLGASQLTYDYRPTLEVPRHWHPYTIRELNGRRWLEQGRLADLTTSEPSLRPEPRTALLRDPQAPLTGPAHLIEPAAVPSHGLRLERRWVLARRTDGGPVLWSERRRIPLVAPPASQLRFDVLQPPS